MSPMIPLSRLVDLRMLGGLAVLSVIPSAALAQAAPVFEDGQAQGACRLPAQLELGLEVLRGLAARARAEGR